MHGLKKIQSSQHWDGKEYARISFPQYAIDSEFLAQNNFNLDEAILDIGCGDGRITREIAKKVPEGNVIGIDASNDMIQTAIKAENPSNVKFVLLNAQEINFSQQFNTVTIFFCMQWVPDKLQTFRRIFNSLKINGRFLMIVPLPHPYLPAIRYELCNSPKWKNYFKDYADPLVYVSDSNYKFFAENAGFNLGSYCVDSTPINFLNYQAYFDFMAQMTPHLNCLPTKVEKDNFLTELLNMLLKKCPPEIDGSFQLRLDLVKFVGIREQSTVVIT